MFILAWIPLYSTARLIFLTWLVLPQTQGATYLYKNYVEVFLIEYEGRIDNLISDAHQRINAAGGRVFVKAVEWIQATILGRPPVRQVPQAAGETYAQNLLRRFTLPVSGFPAPVAAGPSGNDFSGLLTSFTSTLGLGMPTTHARDATAARGLASTPPTLIPPGLKSMSDRVEFVKHQREQLRVLLGALDKEALNLDSQRDLDQRLGSGPGGLNKSKSEVNFEVVERPIGLDGKNDDHDSSGKGKAAKAGWLGGWWPASATERLADGSVTAHPPQAQTQDSGAKGFSSGVEL